MNFSKMKYLLSICLIAGLMVGCSSDQSNQSSSSSQQPQQQPQAQQQGPKQGQGKKSPMLNKKKKSVDPSSITDQELQQFADAMQKAQKVKSQAQSDMKKIVEDEGLTFKRFRQIMMSKRSKKLKKKMNVTKEEQAKMDKIQPKVQKKQKQARQDITSAIESTGLSMKRFREIGRALRQNKKLMKRFKKIQSGSGKQGK